MGYRIEYSGSQVQKIIINRKKEFFNIFGSAILLAFLTLFACGLGIWLQAELFADHNSIAAAADQMIRDIRNGDPLQDTVEAFCQELIR